MHYIVDNHNEASTSNRVTEIGHHLVPYHDENKDQVDIPYNADAPFRRPSPEQTFNTQIALEGGQNCMEYNCQAQCTPIQTMMIQQGESNNIFVNLHGVHGVSLLEMQEKDITVTRSGENGECK